MKNEHQSEYMGEDQCHKWRNQTGTREYGVSIVRFENRADLKEK